MPTTDELQGPQLLAPPGPSIERGQTSPLPDDNELMCSPWLGLHYRAEER